jgi:hypothetical protein
MIAAARLTSDIPLMPLETGSAIRTMPLLLPHDYPSPILMIHPNVAAIHRRPDQDRRVLPPFPNSELDQTFSSNSR